MEYFVKKTMKEIVSFFTIIMILSLTACYPTGKEPVGNKDFLISTEELNASDSENITYDFNLEYSGHAALRTASTRLRGWDEEELRGIFFGDEDGNYELQWQDVSSFVTDPEENIQKFYMLPDGRSLHMDAGEVSFYDMDKDMNFIPSLYNLFLSDDVMREYFPNQELESFSSDDALQTINEIMEKLSLPVHEKPEVYAVDEAACKRLQEEFGVEREEEVYFIVYPMSIEDISVLTYRSCFSSLNVDLTVRAYAEFNKDGLIAFSCCGVPEKEMAFQEFSGCTAKEAAMQIKRRMESMSFTSNVKISGGSLRYVPINLLKENEYQLKPMWVFLEEQEVEGDSGNYYHRRLILVDPETQNVIE